MTTSSLSEATQRQVESFVDGWLTDYEVPGAAVAIVDEDGPLYARGFGARRLEDNAPVTTDTLFGVGSVTKSFTALAIMQLVEDGALRVDERVSDVVGHFEGTDVTVRDLLTHSSGLPSDGSAVVLISRLADIDPFEVPMSDDADFARHVAGAADERVTDEDRFFYYNSGYTVLGEVVEALSGRPYAEFVRERILAPLGMERSTFSRSAFEAEADRLTPYYEGRDGTTEASFPFDERLYAPGGLLSSVAEMATYVRLHLGGGEVDGTRVLDADLTAALHDPVTTRRVSLDGTPMEYACGWMVSAFLDDTLVGHGGSITVSSAYAGFLEDAGLGVVVECASHPGAHPMVVGPAILAICRGEEPADAVPQFGLAEKCAAVAGEYESYRGIQTATVEAGGGSLDVTLSTGLGDQSLTAFPETTAPSDLRFYTVDAMGDRVPLEFRETEDGVDLLYERWRLHR